jgi:hypothetical protein
MNHPNRYSYIILESPPKDKWGVVVKVWANIILSRTKVEQQGQKEGGAVSARQ